MAYYSAESKSTEGHLICSAEIIKIIVQNSGFPGVKPLLLNAHTSKFRKCP